jgi:hypothetical protein
VNLAIRKGICAHDFHKVGVWDGCGLISRPHTSQDPLFIHAARERQDFHAFRMSCLGAEQNVSTWFVKVASIG